jgi:predicted PurR-regulated permease PerM
MAEDEKKQLTLQTITLPVLVIAAGTAFMYFAAPVLIPVLLALALAYLLIPPVNLLKRKLKLPHTLAIAIVMTLVVGVFILLGFVVINEAADFAQSFPELKEQATEKVKEWNSSIGDYIGRTPVEIFNTDSLTVEPGQVRSVGQYLMKGITSVTNFLVGLVLIFFLVLFILLDSEMFARKLRTIFGQSHAEATGNVLDEIDSQVRSFVQSRFYILIGYSVVVTVALLIMGVNYAYIWGPFAGFLNLIPYIGSIVGSIPPVIVAGIQYNSIMKMVWVAVLFLVLQTIEGNYITPKITAGSVNLNSLTILVSISYFGWIWGAVGMLLAIPLTAAIKVVCDNIEPLKPIGIMMGGEK